jgi:hypothetical protein
MKKAHLLTAFLLACALLALTACNAAPQEQTTATAATEQTLTATTTSPQPPAQTTESILIETTTEATTTVPPANIKPIRSILLYTYNAYAAASAGYGCNFYYFTPDLIARGRTKKTPINTADPLKTENMELMVSVVPQDGIYETICEQMWELRFDRLPSRLDANRGIYMDHSEYYLTVTFEDGSSKTSSGYAITELNETYRKVVNLMHTYTEKFRYESSQSIS